MKKEYRSLFIGIQILFCLISCPKLMAHEFYTQEELLREFLLPERFAEDFSRESLEKLAANKFSKYIASADSDKKLLGIIGGVMKARLPKKDENRLYEQSYAKCIEHLAMGEEWSVSIMVLIEEYRELSLKDLKVHLNYDDKDLRLTAEKFIKRRLRHQEKNLLADLASSDIPKVAKALELIHDELIVSDVILSAVSDLLYDPRPAWRSGGDVIESINWLAYRAMKRITEFEPSQPSIHHHKKVEELENFIQKKYPAIFGSKKSDAPNVK